MPTNETAPAPSAPTSPVAPRIFRGYSMDFTSQIEWAQRGDGQWFKRGQFRDPRYGYKWSAWQPSCAPSATATESTGRVRLPRAA